ncbi:MAG: ATP-binding protein [Rubrivivax sp.]|nr:ATP-binding protein [Rubrivivax sp.]
MTNSPLIDLYPALASLGFRAEPDALAAFFTHAHKSRLGPTQVGEGLVALERRAREATNLARRTRAAYLGKFKPLERFDWAHPRKIDRALIERLAGLDFIARGENVLLRGQSGVGKTMLAQNLGHAALLAGHTVRFTTLAAALADLLQQESIPAFERRLKRYLHPRLLVLDELGYLPVDSRAADMLYAIVSRRHEQRSTIISTNLAFKQWGTVFPGAACVGALVDRFAQHCHKVDIDADSWRDQHNFERDDNTRATPPAASRPRKRP